MNNRQEYNIKIANLILEKCLSSEGEHLRFQQLLFNLGITEQVKVKDSNVTLPILLDKYNEESATTYNKLIKTV